MPAPLWLMNKVIKLMKRDKSAGTCLIMTKALESFFGGEEIQQIFCLIEAETPEASGDEETLQIRDLVKDIIQSVISLLNRGRVSSSPTAAYIVNYCLQLITIRGHFVAHLAGQLWRVFVRMFETKWSRNKLVQLYSKLVPMYTQDLPMQSRMLSLPSCLVDFPFGQALHRR